MADNSQNFILRLKDHLLAHQNNILYDRDEHAFSNEEQGSITFISNHMYRYNVICINYITYDLHCAQDSINVQTHLYLITLAYEEEEGTKSHPYWYVKVLGIFHVNVRCSGCMETKHIEFL
jgi:hypothetical protein